MNYKITVLNIIGFFISLYGIVGFSAWAYGRVFYNDTESDVTMNLIPYFIGIGLSILLLDYILQTTLKLTSKVLNIFGIVTLIALFYLGKVVF